MKKKTPKAKKSIKRKTKAKKSSVKRPPKKKAAVKKKPAKKAAKKKAKKAGTIPRPTVIPPVNSVLLGFVEDYYAKIGVIALVLKAPVAVGKRIQVLGHTTNFEQTVDSMQIDHLIVSQAAAKDGVGIKVINRARAGDHVYLLK